MRTDPQLLVIGPAALGAAIADALPQCRSVATENLLGGVWTLGHREFDGVVVSYSLGQRVLTAIRSLREIAPAARIVVTVPASEEPNVGGVLEAGADDYVLEPLQREDLQAVFDLAPPVHNNGSVRPAPSMEEVVRLSEVLKNLDEGPHAVSTRLASLLQTAFDAQGVTVRLDDITTTAGQVGRPVLQEPIQRQDSVVGSVVLGRCRGGSYSARDAARLTDYAKLIDTIVGQVREREHWRELAWCDDLSGLRNRRYFDARLDELLARAGAERLRLTVLLFDIDDFKTYNDRYGHDTGDALIREVAALLTHCSREQDVVARYGGDEFAVILWDAEKPRVPGSQHPTDPSVMADRFCEAIREHDFKCLGADAPGPVTISGGLACFPWDGKTRADIMRAADVALLEAKRAGKNAIMLAKSVNGAPGTNGGTEAFPAESD